MWRRRPDAGGKLLPVRSCGTGQDGKSSHNWRASKVDADDPESSPTALWPSGDFTDSPASRYDTTPQCRISTLSHSAASAWLPARKRSKKNLRHLLFITLVLPLFTTRALGALRPPARVANRGAAKSIPAALSPLQIRKRHECRFPDGGPHLGNAPRGSGALAASNQEAT